MRTNSSEAHSIARRYIESSRLLTTKTGAPPEMYSFQKEMIDRIFQATREISGEELELPEIIYISSLEKRSEYLFAHGLHILIHDQFLIHQSSFLNKIYFAVPESHITQAFLLNIASQRCIRHSYFSASRL